MAMARRPATVMVGVVLGALLAGCTSVSDDRDDGSGGAAEAVGGDVIRLLADVGVGVYDDPAAAEPLMAVQEPLSPVRLLKVQADALAYQVEGGTGFTAAELDDLTPRGRAGQLDVTASKAIDGWAEHAGTPAANLATHLLTRPDDVPDEVPDPELPRYSELVLLLFASDLATAGSSLARAATAPATGLASPAAYVPPTAVTIGAACQKVVAFAGNVQAAVNNALNKLIIDPPPVRTGFSLFDAVANAVVQRISGLANTVVRGTQVLVDGVVRATVGEVMQFVGRIAGVVGTLASVMSHIQQWQVTVGERDPAVNQMGVAPAQQGPAGTVIARVHTQLNEWPKDIAQCAAAVKRPLPSLRPEGSKVTWALEKNGYHGPSGMVLAVRDGTRTEAQLTSRGAAQLGYHAGVEPEPGENAPEETGVVYARISIQRDDLTELRKSFQNLVVDAITGALPLGGVPFARTLIDRAARKLLTPVTDGVVRALEKLRTERKRGMIVVTYHGKAEEPEPPPSAPPGAGAKARVPRGCPGGATIGYGVYLIETQTDAEVGWGVPNAVGCIYARGATYPFTVWIAPARATQVDASGRLAFTVKGRRRSALSQSGGFQHLALGAEAAWIRHTAEAVDVVAVVGSRTLVVSALAPSGSRERAVGVAERVLGLR